MRHLLQAAGVLALVLAVVAVGLFLLSRGVAPPETLPTALPRGAEPDRPYLPPLELPKGGVYAGIVVDPEGKGIPGATVLLVAFDTGESVGGDTLQSLEDFDLSLVARIGFRTAAEAKTDLEGKFHVAADADSAIRVVAAWHPGFVPALESVEQPEEGIRIQLQQAGQLIGRIVDDETGRPVPFAQVALYLQQRTVAPSGAIGQTTTPDRQRAQKLTPFAAAQRWVAEVLGPRVWGVEWEGDETLRIWSDKNGIFRFGPIGDEVQLEFVITHANYIWIDFDVVPEQPVKRLVIAPGEVVERTFRLVKGKSVKGRVVDENGRGVPDVLVSVDHLAQYTQHWWYRTKARRSYSKRDGSFEVKGLSFGPWKLSLSHPSFGRSERHRSVDEETAKQGLVLYLERLGSIEGTIEGQGELRFGMRVKVTLEATEPTADVARYQHLTARLDTTGKFKLPGVTPGRYRVWVRGKGLSSKPVELEVESLAVAQATFELAGGGVLVLRVWDSGGRIVDPATVTLVSRDEGGGPPHAVGHLITRQGKLEADGIVAGRYVARVEAPGFYAETSEPFTVAEDRTTDAGDITLRRPALLRIVAIEGPEGRTYRSEVHVSVQEGDGKPRPLMNLSGAEVPVRSGPLTIRATAPEGLTYEETFEADDGARVEVRIALGR